MEEIIRFINCSHKNFKTEAAQIFMLCSQPINQKMQQRPQPIVSPSSYDEKFYKRDFSFCNNDHLIPSQINIQMNNRSVSNCSMTKTPTMNN